MENTTNKSNLPSIITIFLLILTYPIGVLVMWIMAPWSKKTKVIITLTPVILLIILGGLLWLSLGSAQKEAEARFKANNPAVTIQN